MREVKLLDSETGIITVTRTGSVDEKNIEIFSFSGNCFDAPLEVHGEGVVHEIIEFLYQKYFLQLSNAYLENGNWKCKIFKYKIE